MENVWLNKKLKRQMFDMPTSLTEDRELEYESVEGRHIPALLEYWTLHYRRGSITLQEHRAIFAIIAFEFDSQTTM